MSTFKKTYNPHRSAEWNYGGSKWKLSRSKIDLFIECPRCFYIDNVLGTKRPGMPAFTLNIAVDILLKREFDAYRQSQTTHPLMHLHNLDVVPFSHPSLEVWRDPFMGLTHHDEDTKLLVSGGLDDIWVTKDGALIVVDYKSTSKETAINSLADSPWEESYKRQLGVYQWLLRKNGFTVAETGYFLYANADQNKNAFDATLSFEMSLIPCVGDISWIEPMLKEIKSCLDSPLFPDVGPHCEFCPYREACGQKLLKIHRYERSQKGI